MNTTHVIVFPVDDPGGLRLYTNESFYHSLGDLPFKGPLGEREAFTNATRRWFWEGSMEFSIAGVTFVRRSVR